MSAPRVVHLVHDLIRGGSEGQCARVAMGLSRRGADHRVAVFHRRGYFLKDVEAACGPVHEVRIRHAVRWSTIREIRRLARWLREVQADVLHAWDADAAVFGQFAARWAGVRFITSRRDLGQIYPQWKLTLMLCADQKADVVVANAEAIRDHFSARGLPADHITVLPNLLDLDEFDERAARPFPGAQRLPAGPRMAVVNRLDPEKNTGLLIDALARVIRKAPDARLVIAGDGGEMPKLREQVSRLGLESAVCFLGEVHEVPALLRLCRAGALVPSRNEGLSNTILEYMAAGLPVLATDCGGNRELVRDGETGRLLAATASAADAAEAWSGLLEQPDAARAMGRAGRSKVVSSYALGRGLDAFGDLYARLGRGAAGG